MNWWWEIAFLMASINSLFKYSFWTLKSKSGTRMI